MCADFVDPEVFRYRIDVEHTNIREYYEFDEELSCSAVRAHWLSDVEENWGSSFRGAFEDAVEVTKLWETTQQTRSQEPIPLPPPPKEIE